MNGNNHSPLLEIGYNKDNFLVIAVNGLMEDGKPFKAVIQLTRPQAWKLTEDIKFAMNEMEKERM